MTTVSTRTGFLSTYSMVTWLLPSGRRKDRRPVLPHLRKPCHELVGVHDGHRHIFRRLVAGKAEHEPLVSGPLLVLARLVDAHGDVGRLLVYGGEDGARLPVEPHGRIVIADALDRLPDDVGDMDIAARRDLAAHEGETRSDERLARHPCLLVLAMMASSTASEIWSATLSGCPSVTDSEVKRNLVMLMRHSSLCNYCGLFTKSSGNMARHLSSSEILALFRRILCEQYLLDQVPAVAVPQPPDDLLDPGNDVSVHAQLVQVEAEEYGHVKRLARHFAA